MVNEVRVKRADNGYIIIGDKSFFDGGKNVLYVVQNTKELAEKLGEILTR